MGATDLYYKTRCQANDENPEDACAIKIEIQKTDKYITPKRSSETEEEEEESPTKNFQ